MTEFDIFLLGILQGLTEFLPISSSGHLVLAEELLNLQLAHDTLLGVNVLLHAGTLLALLLVYWERWYLMFLSLFTRDQVHIRLLLLLVLATIPAVCVGFLFDDYIAMQFSGMHSIAVSFLTTAFVLWFGERFTNQRRAENLTWANSFFVGVAQAFALIPGLSRSGLSISAGRVAGLSRKEALDFSFLMAVPVLAGASVLTFIESIVEDTVMPDIPVLTIGFVTSFVVSMLAILFLRRFVQRFSLTWFSLYLAVASVFLLLQ